MTLPISSIRPPSPSLPAAAQTQVRIGLLTEMFVRLRESVPLGLLPVALLAWVYAGVVDTGGLALWLCLMGLSGCARWWVASTFLREPRSRQAEVVRWQRFERASTVGVAVAWCTSLWLLDTGAFDGYFYLKLLVLVTLASFTLSTQGMVPSLFAAFLVAFAAMLLTFLATLPAPLQSQAMRLQAGILIYAIVLMLRSRVEHQRVRQWIEARLAQEALVARLNELASRDALTGAFSRAHVQQVLSGLAAAQRREGAPYSVLMLDIDRFKSINDGRGHAVGDEALRRVTAAMIAELRPSDLYGRWGGEEFVAVLPRTRSAAALETAERLRRCIEQLDFEPAAADLRVTTSIGVAESEQDEAVDATILRADDALYQAKRQGRNRVVSARPPLRVVPSDTALRAAGT